MFNLGRRNALSVGLALAVVVVASFVSFFVILEMLDYQARGQEFPGWQMVSLLCGLSFEQKLTI